MNMRMHANTNQFPLDIYHAIRIIVRYRVMNCGKSCLFVFKYVTPLIACITGTKQQQHRQLHERTKKKKSPSVSIGIDATRVIHK